MSDASRTLVIRTAGLLILLLAVGAALLPMAKGYPARIEIGLMLVAAGVFECVAVAARPGRHIAAFAAAIVSLLAGLRLLLDPDINFLTILNVVILWLVVRSAALVLAARGLDRPLCVWIYLAAAIDFALAVLLLVGLPTAMLVYGLFGATDRIVATFAWILAASFIAAGWTHVAAAPLKAVEAD